jgi:hypothetical protein
MPSRRADGSNEVMSLPDVVILVHGTFAASPDEDGPAWWQRGSEHWRWLRAHLPAGVELPGESARLFAWDGRNSQISRLHAANRLLALMLELERQGRGYHLIGHSHGGSVIWEALVSAEVTRRHRTVYAELRRALNDPSIRLGDAPIIAERDDEHAPGYVKFKTRYLPRPAEYAAVEGWIGLPGLRSWTTVGTPFMHHLPARRPFVTGWGSRDLSLGAASARRARRAQLVELLLPLTLILPFFCLLAMPFVPRALLSAGAASVLAPLLLAGWLAAFWVSGRRRYAESLLAREHAALRAAGRYCGRWLGLWSPADEAINALSASARHDVGYEWLCTPVEQRERRDVPALPVPFPVPRLALPAPVGAAHLLPDVLLMAPLRFTRPAVALANRWLEPVWRRGVAKALTRTAQGCDLPAAVAAYVSPWPLPLAGARAHPGLPAAAIARLEQAVAGHNAALGPRARELLMLAALEGLPGALRAAGEDPAAAAGLVHTAYFADEDVRELMLRHICRHRSPGGEPVPAAGAPAAWLAAHQRAVHDRLAAAGPDPR